MNAKGFKRYPNFLRRHWETTFAAVRDGSFFVPLVGSSIYLRKSGSIGSRGPRIRRMFSPTDVVFILRKP